MTSNDEWVQAKANELLAGGWCIDTPSTARIVTAALHEAIERGKAEQDKAVAAERERCAQLERERDDTHAALVRRHKDLAEWQQRAEAAETKLARLDNPDEALVEAVEFEICGDPPGENDQAWARRILYALARTLEGKENSDDDR